MSCIFCEIALKEIKSKEIYETDKVMAFDDINKQAPTHVVIIPKDHITEIEKLEGVLPEIFKAIEVVSKIKNVKGSGFRVVLNSGKNAGQAVDHLHFHLLGGRPLAWPPG